MTKTLKPTVGPDKLNDRYNNPPKSSISVTVEYAPPTDLGRMGLTTK